MAGGSQETIGQGNSRASATLSPCSVSVRVKTGATDVLLESHSLSPSYLNYRNRYVNIKSTFHSLLFYNFIPHCSCACCSARKARKRGHVERKPPCGIWLEQGKKHTRNLCTPSWGSWGNTCTPSYCWAENLGREPQSVRAGGRVERRSDSGKRSPRLRAERMPEFDQRFFSARIHRRG
jgi:hypothetical protein